MMIEGKIQGVRLKPLRVHPDDRGMLVEILRDDDGLLERFGQTSLTVTYPGVIKAFHWHKRQDDLWFVASGMVQAVLHDLRADSPTKGVTETYCLGEWNRCLLLIPKGVAHGYRVLGAEPAAVFYHTSRSYDPASPDELRLPYDDPAIGFDWTTRPR